SVTMDPTALYHMVVSSHRSPADRLLPQHEVRRGASSLGGTAWPHGTWNAPRLRHTLYFLGVRFVQLDWSGTRSPQLQVEHLDEHRKRHGEIDVALRNVSIQPLSNQGHPNEQQKA